ncbi:hypothetical protein GTR04_1226 [Trichophyton interdigitale]|uniref:Uncharacterized protein n=1 Tax=Trichophyton interdigitale TaxID=101480 RepID=A0A9P4YL61_9EURO|nr:hypothetical protein GY631_1985 [Trichophyton interdigitale]KAF3900491.1 hypothetical protein GY632_0742 [Trichophyton interdigitale]KAG8211387.1 hypothetical protein GTR04_1226 [Trichophyton interdigitale]
MSSTAATTTERFVSPFYPELVHPPFTDLALTGLIHQESPCDGGRPVTNVMQQSNLQYECVYAVSRVGKVPGIRARANKPSRANSTEKTVPTPRSESTILLQQDAEGDTDAQATTQTTATEPDEPRLEFGDKPNAADSGQCFDANTPKSPVGMYADWTNPSTDKSLNPFDSADLFILPSQLMSSEHDPSRSSRCHMEFLEHHIQRGVIALDVVMHTNKVTLAEISRLLSQGAHKERSNCAMLLLIAIEQIVTLFERSVGQDPSDSDRASVMSSMGGLTNIGACKSLSRGNSGGNVLPNLRFGSFQISQDEQLELRSYLLQRELQRCLQVLTTLRDSITLEPNPCTKLEERVGKLSSTI